MFEQLSKAINRRKTLWSKENIDTNQRVFNEWEKVILNEFSPEMITLAKPYSFKNNRLTVFLRNSVVACEIQTKKDRIKNSINRNIEGIKVKEIILKVR